jgi:predicted RNase H-like HicB family nuclease
MGEAGKVLKKPYRRVIVPEEDGSFRAEIVEFPGCIAVADSAAEALVTLEEVAESWLEAMLANGNSIPEPLETTEFSGKLVLRLPKSLHAKSAYAAKREGVSLNQFIVTCISESVGARSVTSSAANAGSFVINISAGGSNAAQCNFSSNVPTSLGSGRIFGDIFAHSSDWPDLRVNTPARLVSG